MLEIIYQLNIKIKRMRINDQRLAVIVGIDDYQYEGGKLTSRVNDANAMNDLLSSDYNERPNFHCKLLTSDDQVITRSVLRKQVQDLFKKKANLALFYFSGHGVLHNNEGILVTQDAESYDEGVQINEIINLANNCTTINEIFIILDCCYSGNAANNALMDENAILHKGISVLTASLAKEKTEGVKNEHGVFTEILLNGLKGEAADTLGIITAASLYNYADKMLGYWEQRPVFKAHCTQMTQIRQAKPNIELNELYKIVKYFPSESYVFPLDKSYEPTEKPKNKTNEQIFGYLQKLVSSNLVTPNEEEHMYYAAMNEKSCSLTPLGKFYWKLVKNRKI